jgi:Ca2+-binding EF-hand superfamily protein
MNRYLAALLGTLSIGLCGCESFRPQQPAGPSYDVNGDGVVDRAELWTGLKQRSFVEMDTNRDRMIDRAEWDLARKRDQTAGLFDTVDGDKNGSISYLEYSTFSDAHKQDLDRLIQELDTDKDDLLSDPEIRARPVGKIFKWNF